MQFNCISAANFVVIPHDWPGVRRRIARVAAFGMAE